MSKRLQVTATIITDNPAAFRAYDIAEALKAISTVENLSVSIRDTHLGEEFPCPRCQASDWRAAYYNAVTQGCKVTVGPDGDPVVGEYDGDEEFNEATENEALWCNNCDFEYPLGIFRLLPVNEK